jgi:glycosyltransferase involved in cell wall biosynthesis
MRVLILNQYALPAGEAGITRHGDIGAELVRRGHEVTVIASDFDYFARRPMQRSKHGSGTHNGVRFVWLKTGEYVANDRKRISSMRRYALSAVRAGLRERPNPDIVIGSSPHPLAPLAAYLVGRLRRVPWIFEARDIWPSALVDLDAIRRGGRTHRLLERLERYLYIHANAVVMVPPRGAQRLTELGVDPSKVTHVPNAASTPLWDAEPIPPSLEAILQDFDGRFILVYTGAIGVPHGFETVVHAVRHLRDTRPDIHERLLVLIVGDGVAAEQLRQMADDQQLDNLLVHPAIPKATVRTLLLRSDACLMQAAASDHFKYGFSPNKLFDYFAAGKPILIASELPTLVDEWGTGIRFPPGDPVALADAVARITSTAEAEREAMGRRGLRLAETEYSVSTVTDRYESLLEELVGQARRND